jgi:sugar/nucleoside kinase (ribokinase family)
LVVKPDSIYHVQPSPQPGNDIHYLAGAGDTANAGFIAARLKGREASASGRLGVLLATEKIGQPGSALDDPLQILRDKYPKEFYAMTKDSPSPRL